MRQPNAGLSSLHQVVAEMFNPDIFAWSITAAIAVAAIAAVYRNLDVQGIVTSTADKLTSSS